MQSVRNSNANRLNISYLRNCWLIASRKTQFDPASFLIVSESGPVYNGCLRRFFAKSKKIFTNKNIHFFKFCFFLRMTRENQPEQYHCIHMTYFTRNPKIFEVINYKTTNQKLQTPYRRTKKPGQHFVRAHLFRKRSQGETFTTSTPSIIRQQPAAGKAGMAATSSRSASSSLRD